MLFLILSGLVALAVAISQPRADSQESRFLATKVVDLFLRGLSTPVLRALLHSMENLVLRQRHDHDVVALVFEKKRLFFVVVNLWTIIAMQQRCC